MTISDDMRKRAALIPRGNPERELMEDAARTVDALRFRLWLRRHSFTPEDHDAMNLTTSKARK